MLGFDSSEFAVFLLVAFAAGSGLIAVALPLLSPTSTAARLRGTIADRKSVDGKRLSGVLRSGGGQKDSRRKQIQETLKQADARSVQGDKGVPLRTLISRAGLSLSPTNFRIACGVAGLVLSVLPFLVGLPWYICVLSGVTATFGLPRWILANLGRRRRKAFIEDLADALDVMVRGLKAGLPLSDAMRIIASEFAPPIGPEFMDVVEGQRIGVTIDQGLERMFERMPIPEVSFLGIVINIQSKAGGNLSEALGNLSRMLRERKKLRSKIRAMSQEAKSSAAIIGALPFFIVGALMFLSPKYLEPLFSTGTGHLILACAGIWMLGGVLVMRSMINFDI